MEAEDTSRINRPRNVHRPASRLIVNDREASRVRQIFELYLERRSLLPTIADAGQPKPEARSRKPVARSRQSLLYWRKSFFDPDRLFTWLEPKLWFFWTRTFLVLSAACILFAAGLVWANRLELVSYFAHALRWETLGIGVIKYVSPSVSRRFA